MKKSLLLLLFAICPLASWAQTTNYDFSDNSTGQALYYNITDATEHTVEVVYPALYWMDFTQPTGSLTIPSTVTNDGTTYSVTTIGEYAFYGCTGLTSVSLPYSVTSIGDHAFHGCEGLTHLIVPNSVTTIGSRAFDGTDTIYYSGGADGNPWGADVVITTNYAEEGDPLVYESPYKTIVVGCDPAATSVSIPSTVTTIVPRAFLGCSHLSNVAIPSSVTTIGTSAFEGCSDLTSVVIPNSVTIIETDAFYNCSSLQSIVIPNSVTSIGSYAFHWCTNLKTVYNLSNLIITKEADTYGEVAKNALRVLSEDNGFSIHGTGDNTLHQIDNNTYSVVDAEDGTWNHIPRSTIPANFIYYDGITADNASGWKAEEIILTDSQDEFNAPVAFTADKASYSRDFTNTYRSTLYLPFSAPIPEGFEVFTFDNYDNNTSTLYFTAHTENIAAYTPYLVGYDLSKADHTSCTVTNTNVLFPATTGGNFHPASSNNMTFQGTTARTCMDGTNYGYSNGFFVRSGNGSDHTTHAHVNPFRCYFSYTGTPAQMPPVTLGVGFDSSPLGIETPEAPDNSTPSIRYSNDVYDLMGRLVRHDAHSLLGLPNGIYIWRGQKLLHHN